jgi:Na+/H+-dicarboxylate symporter
MDFVVDVVPENFFAASSDNSKMLQIIFVALLFGIAMVALGDKQTAVVFNFVESINLIILKIVDFIMNFAPYGVMALMAGLIVDFSGNGEMFSALGMYALTVVVSLLILAFVFYPVLIKLFTKIGIIHYLKSIFPIQLLAFSTSSSSATLPFTMEQSKKTLVYRMKLLRLYSCWRHYKYDGTSCYQAIAIFFIAQILASNFRLLK